MSKPVSDGRDGWGSARISPLVLLLAALLLILILPPTLFLVDASLHVTNPDGSFGAFTLQYYRQLFNSPYLAVSLRNTILYAIGSAVVAIGLGAAAALPCRPPSCRSGCLTFSMWWPGFCCSDAPGR